jgi:hypothetical protein
MPSFQLAWALVLLVWLSACQHTAAFHDCSPGDICGLNDPVLASIQRVALFNPFGMNPGTGERYLLSFIDAFRKLDALVEVIVFDDSHCYQGDCVEETAKNMRLRSTLDDFNVRLVSTTATSLSEFDDYDVFVCIGLSKFPLVPTMYPIGKLVNIYICQFPIDWRRGMKDIDNKVDRWAAYDLVLVNSEYTFDWYITGVVPWIHRQLRRNIFVPTVDVLHPAVEPYPATLATPGGWSSQYTHMQMYSFIHTCMHA